MSFFRRNEQPRETPDNQEEASDTEMQEAGRSHVQKLTEIFQESWKKNRMDGDPDVSFNFLFAAHEYAHDVPPDLRSQFENADIFMLEAVAWTDNTMELWRKISEGRAGPSLYKDPYAQGIMDALYNTGVVVLSPDLPHGHPQIEREPGVLWEEVLHMPFDEAVKNANEYWRELANMNQAREEEIMKNIPTLIRRAREENETLQKKKSLNVVLSYGSLHTPLFQALSRTGKDTKREMPGDGNYVYAQNSELYRRHLFGVAGSEDNLELSARALVGESIVEALHAEIRGLKPRGTERFSVYRTAIDSLSPEDLRDVWDVYLKEGDSMAALSVVKEKGFVVPKTRAELDELLQSKRKP